MVFLLYLFLAFLLPQGLMAATIPTQTRYGLDVGYTSIDYTEDHVQQPSLGAHGYEEGAIRVKAMYRYYLLPPSIDFAADASYTAVPLNSNLSGTNASFLEGNARLGWVVPGLPRAFSLSIMAGVYYETMFVTGDAFGFKNLTGPQFYPEFNWATFSSTEVPTVLSSWFKFSPVSSGGTSLTFSNRVIAAGTRLKIPAGGQSRLPTYAYLKAFSFGVDYMNIQESIVDLRTVNIYTSIWTLSIGYDW